MAATQLAEKMGTWHKKVAGFSWSTLISNAKDVQEFNEWYNKEHLPELLSVPSILSAARYRGQSKGGPQYLACYELDSVEVMQTPAFTNRPRTPWGQKVSPSVIGKNLTRIVGEQIYPDGIEMPDRSMAPVLQIGRVSVPASRSMRSGTPGTRVGEYVPGYARKVPGVIYAPTLSGFSKSRRRLQHGLRIYQHSRAPKGPEWRGATASIPRPIRRACGKP